MSINNIVSEIILDQSLSIGANVAGDLGVACTSGVAYSASGVSLDISYMQKSVVNLTAADILALAETPFEIVAAPASSTAIIYIDKILIESTPVTTAYSVGSALLFQYTNGPSGGSRCAAYSISSMNFIAITGSTSAGYVDCSGAILDPTASTPDYAYAADIQQQPVCLTVSGLDFTLGDATITVTAWYRVI